MVLHIKYIVLLYTAGGYTMYQSNINIDAIRTIDTIVQTPKVNYQPTTSKMTYKEAQSFQDEKPLSLPDYQNLVEEASAALSVVNTELIFRVHEGTGRPIIQIVEQGTNNVVREIPPEKMLDVVAGIWEWAGLMVDRKE